MNKNKDNDNNNEIVTEGLRNFCNNTRKASYRFSIKTSLEKSHTIRKLLQSEIWRLSGGVHHWFKGRNTRGKETYDDVMTTTTMMIIMIIIICYYIPVHF